MKRISLFSALLILLMFLASCNAVSRTDPEKGNTDNAVSLEEGGFDIG
ncbi:unknown [Ruminococcus sp. CAG:382]|nr:unknown [Ruminococcus sp. CAG:382]